MKHKSIALDCDEVLMEFVSGICFYNNSTYKTFFERKHFKSYNFWETLGGTRDSSHKLVEEFYNSSVFDNLRPIKGAVPGVNTLKKKGHELFVVTSRPIHIADKTKSSLYNYFLKSFSEVYFSSEWHHNGHIGKKSEVCKSIGIELIVEDNIDNALDCASKGVEVILLDAPWNQTSSNYMGIHRVSDWNGILKKIEELKS